MTALAQLDWIEHHFTPPKDADVIVQKQYGRRVAVIPHQLVASYWPRDGEWNVHVRGTVQRADGTRGTASRSASWTTRPTDGTGWSHSIEEAPDWVVAALDEARA